MIITIACIDKRNGIGKNGKLLYHLPEDLRYFRNTTSGHNVVMGYNTFLSLGCIPLKNRRNIVITNKSAWELPQTAYSCMVVRDFDCLAESHKNGILSKLGFEGDLYIIGGGQLYQSTEKYWDRMILTVVDAVEESDTFFPSIDYSNYQLIDRQSFDKKDYPMNDESYEILTYQRIK